jgi:hypothetical protein
VNNLKSQNLFFTAGILLFLVSCSPAKTLPATNLLTSSSTQTVVSTDEPSPEWTTIPVIDSKTGQSFTIKDKLGKVIVVEGMATWCPSCWAQGRELKTFLSGIKDTSNLVVIGLSLDTKESATDLNDYAKIGGYSWQFVTSTIPLYRDMGNRYGASYLDPTLGPMFIIDKEGQIKNYRRGLIRADELTQIIQPLLDK